MAIILPTRWKWSGPPQASCNKGAFLTGTFRYFWCHFARFNRNSCPQLGIPNQGVMLVSTMTRYHCCTLSFLAHLCILILYVILLSLGSWTREICNVKNCTPTATLIENNFATGEGWRSSWSRNSFSMENEILEGQGEVTGSKI